MIVRADSPSFVGKFLEVTLHGAPQHAPLLGPACHQPNNRSAAQLIPASLALVHAVSPTPANDVRVSPALTLRVRCLSNGGLPDVSLHVAANTNHD
jgi:hypothetical protein